jgi:hypothetical protein
LLVSNCGAHSENNQCGLEWLQCSLGSREQHAASLAVQHSLRCSVGCVTVDALVVMTSSQGCAAFFRCRQLAEESACAASGWLGPSASVELIVCYALHAMHIWDMLLSCKQAEDMLDVCTPADQGGAMY